MIVAELPALLLSREGSSERLAPAGATGKGTLRMGSDTFRTARDTAWAMSEENVEVVQAAWAAWERNGLAGFTEYWADDIDWRAIGGRWRGKDAGRAYLQELLGSFDEINPEPIEFIDAGDQRVITVLRYSGREKRTGIEVPPEYFAVVNEVRNGKMVTGREYATRKEALQAAGLRE